MFVQHFQNLSYTSSNDKLMARCLSDKSEHLIFNMSSISFKNPGGSWICCTFVCNKRIEGSGKIRLFLRYLYALLLMVQRIRACCKSVSSQCFPCGLTLPFREGASRNTSICFFRKEHFYSESDKEKKYFVS